MSAPVLSPSQAWELMKSGNDHFIAGTPMHPRQDVERRAEIAIAQTPQAALFGCADSRLSAEIIFDCGLGDLFVVRNAGQVMSSSVIGSLEYAVATLGVALIIVLSHDDCGAVRVAIEQDHEDAPPLPPHILSMIESIEPAVTRVRLAEGKKRGEELDAGVIGREHLRDTVSSLLAGSELISVAVAEGKLALVGANYTLDEGRVTPDVIIGSVESD